MVILPTVGNVDNRSFNSLKDAKFWISENNPVATTMEERMARIFSESVKD